MLKIMLYTFLCFVCRNLFTFCMVAGSLMVMYTEHNKKKAEQNEKKKSPWRYTKGMYGWCDVTYTVPYARMH